MGIEHLIRKYALQNAVKYHGKANVGAVIGKILQEDPSLKSRIAVIGKLAGRMISQINKISVDKQLAELQELAPELLEKKEKEEKDIFAFLGIKPGQKIVTGFPPEPSKYPHIGHAKAIILNHELARKHNGKFILRFDDTNPMLVKEEFYEIHLDNYKWLGLEWDKLDYGSDHLETCYKYGEQLIANGNAYVCTCSQERIKKSRLEGIACGCRRRRPDENLGLWRQLPKMDDGSAIVRMKIDLEHKNTAMRDPTIFRIIHAPHPRLGDKYTLWPTYDFETTIMDCIGGITHRLRSKEFELRNELQRHIQRLLGFAETSIYEFARFNLEGVPSQGRIIREMINNKELIGWDDPSLTTIVALRRRGFLPESIKNFVLSTGITKSEATLTWDDLIVQNRRLLDRISDRYFFVADPVMITIDKAQEQQLHLRKHPELPERGTRSIVSKDKFYLTRRDEAGLVQGELYRLMDCLNFRREKKGFVFDSLEYQKFKQGGKKIIHYLPVIDNLVSVAVLMPDHSLTKGLAEPAVSELQVGAQIQFERFGFVRLDSIEDNVYKFWYTHQ
jgi:glutamyl-tRNA synthetase